MLEQATSYYNLSESEIKELQTKLSKLGYYPYYYIDGIKGNLTQTAIKSFAQDHWLNTDETMVLGKTFLFLLEEKINKKNTDRVSVEELQELSQEYNLELAILQAFIQVEAGSKGFIGDHPKILYEAHYFYDLTNGRHGQSDISSRYWDSSLYVGGRGEHGRLAKAMTLDYHAALQSCSWGLGQIMGSHFEELGCRSITEFVKLNYQSEQNQIKFVLEFLRVKDLLKHARNKNWRSLARGYNGSGYAQNNYHNRLRDAYLSLTGLV